MKCFYHTDLDGRCAGAIVYKFYKDRGEQCEFIPIDYKDDFPFDKIISNEKIIIVDFSLQKEGELERLIKITDNIIWIDHHKTAIEKHKHINLRGVREDGVAGCVLTWQWFYPSIKVPIIVEMLGDYDIWDFSKHGENLNKLQTAIKLYQTAPEQTAPEGSIWQSLFNMEKGKETLIELLGQGDLALRYRNNHYADLIKSWAFWSMFEGYKAICCNVGNASSQVFDSIKEDYDLMIPFIFDGKQWTVSLYTKKDIDVSTIAKKYGGGGHEKAAGFQCSILPFKRIS